MTDVDILIERIQKNHETIKNAASGDIGKLLELSSKKIILDTELSGIVRRVEKAIKSKKMSH